MKKTLLIIAIILTSGLLKAQPGNPDQQKKLADLRKIQAMEMAFITKELNLTPDEAQKFWPVFNQYRNEMKVMAKDRISADQLEKQQKMLDLRKKYREDFTRVINQERANKVFGAEDEFRSLVRREFQKRQVERRQIEPRKKGF
ncbi:MAG: hypothetical protein ACK5AO_04715 [bacterium]|jgi:hypothetical protein